MPVLHLSIFTIINQLFEGMWIHDTASAKGVKIDWDPTKVSIRDFSDGIYTCKISTSKSQVIRRIVKQ